MMACDGLGSFTILLGRCQSLDSWSWRVHRLQSLESMQVRSQELVTRGELPAVTLRLAREYTYMHT